MKGKTVTNIFVATHSDITDSPQPAGTGEWFYATSTQRPGVYAFPTAEEHLAWIENTPGAFPVPRAQVDPDIRAEFES